MSSSTIDHLMLREEFNKKIKPKYRDSHTPQCQKCMRFHKWGNSIMEVHHIKSLVDGGTNDEDNLVTLCYECHKEWHEHRETNMPFREWMQKVPLYIYSAIGLIEDKKLKCELFCGIDELWPAFRDRRMVTEPWTDENIKYVNKNSSKWIDW